MVSLACVVGTVDTPVSARATGRAGGAAYRVGAVSAANAEGAAHSADRSLDHNGAAYGERAEAAHSAVTASAATCCASRARHTAGSYRGRESSARSNGHVSDDVMRGAARATATASTAST